MTTKPEIETKKEWTYKGRKLIILWVRNYFCSYVETKLKGVSYSQEFGSYETSPSYNVSAHGGLTYSGDLDKKFGDIYFFGIDFAHSGDYMEGDIHFSEDEHKWTIEEVEKETEQMADSIIKYEKKYGRFKKAFNKFQKEIGLI